MVHLFALSGKTLALLSSGRLAELSRTLREGRETAERNGTPPWLFLFREARLRAALFDFEGALALCSAATAAEPDYPTGQPETIARLAAGYLALDRGRLDEAERCFEEICDPGVTAKFFLHWTWRMSAQIGQCDVRLASGDVRRARSEAEAAVGTTAATDEPNLRALARDARARVALASRAWRSADDDVQSALALAQEFEIPTVAWRLHATAAELRERSGHEAAAEEHRATAKGIVLRLAGSLPPDEPMRHGLLRAAAARGIV